MLKPSELQRYSRHILLPEIGKEGQEKLKAARVLVIGAGGLGCPVLQYLTAAGVGTIGIIDFDVVEESNLHRQILFNTGDVGKSKAETAGTKLSLQNPHIRFEIHNFRLTTENAIDLLRNYDIVVDGSDNFPTRYLVNDACVITDTVLVFGSIFKFEGQVSVFNYTQKDGKKGPTYRCLFPEPPDPKDVPGCAVAGVLGVLPGITGSLQASETIKIITGVGEPLSGKLLAFDALTMEFRTIKFSANAENHSLKTLTNYEAFCQPEQQEAAPAKNLSPSGEISVAELKVLLDKKENIALLDVREPHEYEICHLGGQLIPMNTIPRHIEKIPMDKPVIVYCHHGMRSEMIVKFLKEEFGYSNLYNLTGGIHAWAVEIDKNMPKY